MIERYTPEEIGKIWSEENKYKIWLDIEVLATEAQTELGIVPKEALAQIKEKANFNVERILEIEETTKHDVIAFLTNVEEYVGEPSRFIHFGMTSSDVLDTCLSVQLKQAGELIKSKLQELLIVIEKRAKEFKYTVCIGRSHGIHAEPTTMGLKFALWHEEAKRNLIRLDAALESISYGKISGAVGTFEHMSPKVEEFVCEKLGLKAAPVSTQVLQRDRHAEFMTTLAIIGSSLEKIGTEIRHLQRTEVLEAEEFFSKGQKGSSAMPHKRNPIVSERLCGIARVLRGNALAAMENNALWHERDISHSSVERVICPDSTIILYYGLKLAVRLLDNLLVYPENMKRNFDLTLGLVYSQKVLLELAKLGLKRQTAYEIVQSSAMKTWQEKRPFIETLSENELALEHLSKERIAELFNMDNLFKNVDTIFERCHIR